MGTDKPGPKDTGPSTKWDEPNVTSGLKSRNGISSRPFDTVECGQ